MPADFLGEHGHLDETETQSAVVLRDVEREPTLLGHLAPELGVVHLAAVDVFAHALARRPRVEQLTSGIPQRKLVTGEIKVHGGRQHMTPVSGHPTLATLASTWPLRISFPIFVANAVDWLNPASAQAAQLSVRAGDPFRLSLGNTTEDRL